MPRRPTGSVWYGLAFLALLVLAQTYFLVPAGRQVPYSEFKGLLKEGKVADVTVGEQVIRGTLKAPASGGSDAKPEAFTTTRIEDPNLVAELEQSKVKYAGETVSRWLPEVLSWIIPLLLLVGVWSFFFRRMGSAEGGVMSFARSRAKIYAEDEVKVKFTDVAGVDEAEDEEVHKSRRAHSERRVARRSSRDRKNAAGESGRRGGQGAVLQLERL